MAQIVEERIIIKISQLVPDDAKESSRLLNVELLNSLRDVVQELIGTGGPIVEIDSEVD